MLSDEELLRTYDDAYDAAMGGDHSGYDRVARRSGIIAVRDAVLEAAAVEAEGVDSYVLLRDGNTTTISKYLRSLKGPQ